jgi:hypothetical protein
MKELTIATDQLNKQYLAAVTSSIVERVKDGEYSALDTYIQLKAYEKVISEAIKEIQMDAINEADVYNKADRTKFGVEFELTSGRTYFDYEADQEYAQLNEALKKRKELLTDAAKAQKKGRKVVDENGEVIQPPPMKESSVAVGITIKFK